MRINKKRIIKELIEENAEFNDNFKGKYAYINGVNHAFNEISEWLDRVAEENEKLKSEIQRLKKRNELISSVGS